MRSTAGLIAFVAMTASPAAASALGSLVVTANQPPLTEGDDKSYTEVHVESGGALKVRPYPKNPRDMGTGMLHIKATKIVVDEGGIIDASGVGYPGIDSEAGKGPGGGLLPTSNDLPGGGGAFMGDGSQGADPSCNLIGGLGGTKYGDKVTPMLGSAGGAAKVTGVSFGGGAGGGVIILEANTIEINGTVTVAGVPGTLTGQHGSGGGAGGTLWFKAFDFKVGPKAVISAAGGAGVGGTLDSGGGGGGGLILLEAKAPSGWNPVLGGGVSGPCPAVAGQPGLFVQLTPPTKCFDLDMDGVAACDGDCDDLDPAIHPNAPEKCDGIDNDCSGDPDDPIDESELCAEGRTCDAGLEGGPNKCWLGEAGVDAGVEPPPKMKSIEYFGGCSAGPTGAASAAAAVAAWALALGARRQRRSRR